MVRYHLVNQKSDQHAVVIGAEIAGLLMARVLVDHFQKVTVIGQHRLSDAVPSTLRQALPMHVLAVQGQRHLERLFPGLTAELITDGAPTVSWTADAPLLLPGGWGPRFHSDLISRPTTYNLLVRHLRQRLSDYGRGRILFLEPREIVDVDPPQIAIRSAASGTDTVINADLIVDTSDHAVSVHKQPEPTVVDGGKGLAVQVFQRPAGLDLGWRALLMMTAEGRAAGAIVPVENQMWLVMLNELETLPTSDVDFISAARCLRLPVFADALSRTIPRSPVFATDDTANRFYHYHQIPNWSDRLIVSQIVRFNPALGLDLFAVTLGALTLRDTLDDQRKRYPDGHLSGLGARYQKRLARALMFPWRLAVAHDGAVGNTRPSWMHWYGDQVIAAASYDSSILGTLLTVASFVTPPRQLFSLPIMRHVWHQMRGSQVRVVESAPPQLPEKRQTITQEIAAVVLNND